MSRLLLFQTLAIFSLRLGSALEQSSNTTNSSEIQWYQRGPLYQIYPLSFGDSDGDGNGDLRGIIEHVDHLKDIGIEAVWMNPIFESPMKDNGYDISNFTEINPLFGTMEDFEEMITAFHENDIRVLLDFVPNHSSNEHQWFNDSIYRVNGKEDFYVWMDPSGYDSDSQPIPPNNWLSIFTGSMWEWNDVRQQFYLHQFGVYQPDFNCTNPDVIDALKEVMRFWLRKGVDGFRMDAVLYLIENNYDLDKEAAEVCITANSALCQEEAYTIGQPENFEVVKTFNDVYEEEEFKNRSLINVIEAYTDLNTTVQFYDRQNVPFNFELLSNLKNISNASVYVETIEAWFKYMPEGKWPNWVAGNHDNFRIASAHGNEMVDPMNMILMLLPGLPVTYQGEEIGMSGLELRKDLIIDNTSFFRDPERTPIQWNDSFQAGFTTARKPFLPVNPNFWEVNVQKENEDENSHLKIYKRLVTLHKELIDSSLESLKIHVISTWVFAFERPNHVVVINLNQLPELVNLGNITDLPDSLYVRIPSINAGYSTNDVVNKTSVDMRARSGIVFSFELVESSSSIALLNGSLLLLSLFLAFRK